MCGTFAKPTKQMWLGNVKNSTLKRRSVYKYLQIINGRKKNIQYVKCCICLWCKSVIHVIVRIHVVCNIFHSTEPFLPMIILTLSQTFAKNASISIQTINIIFLLLFLHHCTAHPHHTQFKQIPFCFVPLHTHNINSLWHCLVQSVSHSHKPDMCLYMRTLYQIFWFIQ